MKKYQVYLWTNKVTDKSYVGYTSKDFMKRWEQHIKNSNNGKDTYFYRSIRKYGADSFHGVILFETSDIKLAKEKEKFFIEELKTLNPFGYNSTFGGTGGDTFTFSTEEQKKIRQERSKRVSHGLNNPNAKPVSDDQILDFAFECFKKHGCWKVSEWKTIVHENSLPQYFTSYRFKNYGGGYKGLKNALEEKLISEGMEYKTYKGSEEQRKKLSESMKNKKMIWVSDTKNKTSYCATIEELDKPFIIRGRLFC